MKMGETMYKVSIIIPVYNGEKYIDECIKSVQNQTLMDIEIICVDDGSTDSTASRLDSYALLDERIKVIHKQNSGYGHSMNVGFDAATGEYIGIVEADDYIDMHMFEDLYHCAKDNSLDVIKADFNVFLGDKENRQYIYRPLFEKGNTCFYNAVMNYKSNFEIFNAYLVSWAGIYRRDFLLSNNIRHNETPGASYQDNGFWIQTMIYAQRVLFLDKPYYYLRRDNENSSVYSKEKVFAMCNEHDFMRGCVIKREIDLELLLPFLWKRRYSAYNWEMVRIAYKHREAFLERFSEDFRKAIELKEIDSSTFDEKTWNTILEIVDNPKKYYEDNYKLSDSTIERLNKAQNIAVYGAKALGCKAVSDVQSLSLDEKILGMVVSKLDDNIKIFRGVLVYELDAIDYPKDTLFIIGSQEKYTVEIKESLANRGYMNVMTCQDMKI